MNRSPKKRNVWILAGSVGMGAGVSMFLLSIVDPHYGLTVHGIVVAVLGLISFIIGRAKEKASRG